MAATIVARFADGRLLVQESRLVETNYLASGVPVRIGLVKTVEKVLSIDSDYAKHGLLTPLSEVLISGDQIIVVMRRADEGIPTTLSGNVTSGSASLGLVSGILSGLAYLGPLLSGRVISGLVTITANVIAF